MKKRESGSTIYIFATLVTGTPFLITLFFALGERLVGAEHYFPNVALFQSAVGIIGAVIPLLLHKGLTLRISLPTLSLYSAFILGTVFFGEILEFYYLFPLWDDVFHFTSAMLLSVFGLFIADLGGGKQWQRLALALGFALSVGAVWEILEYASDGIFHTNMQKYSVLTDGELIPLVGRAALGDTMRDLITDLAGASAFTLGAALTGHRRLGLTRVFYIRRAG